MSANANADLTGVTKETSWDCDREGGDSTYRLYSKTYLKMWLLVKSESWIGDLNNKKDVALHLKRGLLLLCIMTVVNL